MSIQAMTWVWGLNELPASETLVLLVLADQANDEGFCWPNQETIAKKARCSVRSVKRAIDSLKKSQLLDIEHRGNSSARGRKSNVYRLNVGADFSLGINQRDNLALKSDDPVDNVTEITTFRCEQSKGSIWHSNTFEPDLGATSGTQIAPAPLIEPSIKTNQPITKACVKREPGVLDGVDGVEDFSETSPVTASTPGVQPAEGVERPDWGLIRKCLPPAMAEILPESAALTVSAELGRALGEGWQPPDIQRKLAANVIPPNLRNGAGLVIWRLRDALNAPVPESSLVEGKRAKYSAWALAEIDRILAHDSRLDLVGQANLLASFISGMFTPGARRDMGWAEDPKVSAAELRLCELQREIWDLEDAKADARRKREKAGFV